MHCTGRKRGNYIVQGFELPTGETISDPEEAENKYIAILELDTEELTTKIYI